MRCRLGQLDRMNSARGRHSSGRHPLFLCLILYTRAIRFFTAGVDFDKNVQRISTLSKLTGRIQLFGQFDAVNTLDHPEIWNLANELVALSALKMADKMPPNILGQHLRLVHELLDVVLSKIAVAIVVQLTDIFSRLLLADCNNSGLLLRQLHYSKQPFYSAE